MENIKEIILQKLYAQCPVHFDFSHIFFAFCSVGLVGGSDRAKPMSSEAAQPLARLAKVGREGFNSLGLRKLKSWTWNGVLLQFP